MQKTHAFQAFADLRDLLSEREVKHSKPDNCFYNSHKYLFQASRLLHCMANCLYLTQFPIEPRGLQQEMNKFKLLYGNPPLFIYENGLSLSLSSSSPAKLTLITGAQDNCK